MDLVGSRTVLRHSLQLLRVLYFFHQLLAKINFGRLRKILFNSGNKRKPNAGVNRFGITLRMHVLNGELKNPKDGMRKWEPGLKAALGQPCL